jgi:hypothetical protein
MKPVPPSDEYENGVGLPEGRETRQLEDRQAAERCRRLQRRPVGLCDANVLEFHAGEMERQAALLTAAHRGIEVDQPGLAHGSAMLSARSEDVQISASDDGIGLLHVGHVVMRHGQNSFLARALNYGA